MQKLAANFGKSLVSGWRLLMSGCGVVASQSVYEGARSVQKGKSIGPVPDKPEWPPFDQYEKERSRISQ